MSAVKDIAASVRAKLLNISRTGKRTFGEVLQYYAMERFLYRLSLSEHSKCFILKGALMLRVWDSPEIRPTMDIDMLGVTSSDEGELLEQIRDVLLVEVDPDGLSFNAGSLQSEKITEDADYQGVRIRFQGTLGTARFPMQIDIGFGDALYPRPDQLEFPTILALPAPSLLCYTRESAIAEKFEAMIKLGQLNSRMKDFYDIWLLSRQFEFAGDSLLEAVRLTFAHRKTDFSEEVEAFKETFANAKQPQWKAFCKRINQAHAPGDFIEIVDALKLFLEPVLVALKNQNSFGKKWPTAGPWF